MSIRMVELWSQAIMHRKKLEDEYKICVNPIKKVLLFVKIQEASSEVERLRPVRSSKKFLEEV